MERPKEFYDPVYNSELTQKFVKSFEEYVRSRDYDLSFIDSVPAISSKFLRNSVSIPKWKNGRISDNVVQNFEKKCRVFECPVGFWHFLNNNNDHIFIQKFDDIFRSVYEKVAIFHRQAFYEVFLKHNQFESLIPLEGKEWNLKSDENSNSNPVKDVLTWIDDIEAKTKKAPNRAIISKEIFNFLMKHESNSNQFDNSNDNITNRKIMADILNLEEVYTIGRVEKDDDKSKSKDCNSFFLFHAPDCKEILDDIEIFKHSPSAFIKGFKLKLHETENKFNTAIYVKEEKFPKTSKIIEIHINICLGILSKELGGIYKPQSIQE